MADGLVRNVDEAAIERLKARAARKGTTERGNVKAGAHYRATVPGVFACGDARRGQRSSCGRSERGARRPSSGAESELLDVARSTSARRGVF